MSSPVAMIGALLCIYFLINLSVIDTGTIVLYQLSYSRLCCGLPFFSAVAEIAKASNGEACSVPAQAEAYHKHVKSELSNLERKTLNKVDDGDHSNLEEDADKYKEQLEADGIVALAEVEKSYKLETRTRENYRHRIGLLRWGFQQRGNWDSLKVSLSDGSRKYKLNMNTYAISQSSGLVSEYYTKIKCVPDVTFTPEISVFLTALNQQKEKQRLFQFHNGLYEHYGNLRSQLLLMVPIPSVENACSMLQQEKSKRVLFGASSVESTALYNKGVVKDKCNICGFKWHPPEKCWEKVGYHVWHPKSKFNANKQAKPRDVQNEFQTVPKTAAHVESGNISFTPQQFELLEEYSADED
ncbi:hypothetical protein CTI12_AA068750 [Artemisia annua]|uniref:Uncharacterized protein n=1 Tax=Artemisia annua TaxID=35608 RepID=A0A2U1Q6T1_ARTAN|nr:hypothetical protein CTI12_AA068750 [Artemisia annua]